jgi:hypothetical protein
MLHFQEVFFYGLALGLTKSETFELWSDLAKIDRVWLAEYAKSQQDAAKKPSK